MRGPFRYCLLDIDCSRNGVHDACELRQQAIAHQLYDATVMSLQRRLDQLFAECAQHSKRPGFVRAN